MEDHENKVTEQPENISKPNVKNKKNWLVIALVVLIVCLIGYIAYGYYANSTKNISATSDATATPNLITSTVADENSPIVDEGVTWQKPEKLDDLKLFLSKNEDSETIESMSYYKVGTTSTGGEIIDAQIVFNVGNGGNFLARIIKRDGQYYFIKRNSDDVDNETISTSKGIQIDSQFAFKSLINDATIEKNKTELVSNNFAKLNIDSEQKGEKIASTKWGDLYLVKGQDLDKSDGKLAVASYQLQLNDSSRVTYQPNPTFHRDDNTFNLTWSIQKGKEVRFAALSTGGCGLGSGAFPLVVDSSTLTSKEELGRSDTSIVYTSEDVSYPLIKIAYDLYNNGLTENTKSIEQFASSVGIAFWTDDYGQTMVFVNQDFMPSVECGKPVVYLYPKTKADVKVKVGAKITKSEPEYGNGWSAIAYPSGKIVADGKIYPYLFWEGLGFGSYPAINEGTIVESSKVKSTIESQLTYIGLNKTEISDFLEFWMPKMPSKKFVRLTWLQNKEMDKLAPLSISPKPDNIIRVFLDFEGLDSSIAIKSQNLIRGERNGFTAVEWGGLLAN
jgi:hypothetical protein